MIHIAGTKGKGSTCAFINSFLAAYGKRTGFPSKIGLHTSPHLKSIQERIRINSIPLSKTCFAKYVFEVWDTVGDIGSNAPRFLQLLFLVTIHTFLKEKVDVAICETYSGGEFDATNVFRHPVATGISTIGMDHVEKLGPTIENIANHKAGIFKAGSPAFTTLQEPSVRAVLESRAKEKGTKLQDVGIFPNLPGNVLSLEPPVQKLNASLAVALTNTYLKRMSCSESAALSADDIKNGALHFSWPGRFQRIVQGPYEWYLDGAHNELSVEIAANWFADVTKQDQR